MGTSIVIGSFLRFCANSDNLTFARSWATESYNITQSRKKTEHTFRFFQLRFRCVDNTDYESGPSFYFPQVINDVATLLATPTPTTPQLKLASRKKSTITYFHNIIFLVFLPFGTVWTKQNFVWRYPLRRGQGRLSLCVEFCHQPLLPKVNL